MLGLFQDGPRTLEKGKALEYGRALLISSLNRGIIPTWDDFFRELPVLNSSEELEEVREYFCTLLEWPFLEEALRHRATEFFFHGPESSQRLTPEGKKESFKVSLGAQDWQLWLEIMALHFKQNWNVKNPFVSFYGKLFGRHFRLSLVHESTSPLSCSKLILRSLPQVPHELSSFGDTELLKKLITEKRNFLIAGSTGSGKTSLLSSLLSEIHSDEHLVILEDTFELISTHLHQTRFLASDTVERSLKAYLTYSLRLTPDRIILGEMRSHEVIPFLLAMNTGHSGLIGTIHAKSAVDALDRAALLFTLYSGESSISMDRVMELLCRSLDAVVFVENKRVKEVIRILGCEKGVPFYERMTLTEGKEEFNLF